MYFDTDNVIVGGCHYCSYCGEESLVRTEFDEYTPHSHYYCECHNASKEQEMNKAIENIKKQYNLKRNKEIINKLHFEWGLKQLKYQYNQK